MSGSKKRKNPRPVFDSIRKPVAPATHKLGAERPDERVHPAKRKAKHKKRTKRDDTNGDI